jgi:hypothetical protein
MIDVSLTICKTVGSMLSFSEYLQGHMPPMQAASGYMVEVTICEGEAKDAGQKAEICIGRDTEISPREATPTCGGASVESPPPFGFSTRPRLLDSLVPSTVLVPRVMLPLSLGPRTHAACYPSRKHSWRPDFCRQSRGRLRCDLTLGEKKALSLWLAGPTSRRWAA